MKKYIYFLLCTILFAGCAQHAAREPEKTQAEIREFQTRTFDVTDYPLVMKSVLHVLQDDGYMVKNVNAELGFISATKDVDFTTSRAAGHEANVQVQLASRVGFGFGVGIGQRFPPSRERYSYPTHQCIEATINVSQFGEQVRVRASFQAKLFDHNGTVLQVKQIDSEQFYQEFFVKVSKGIFLEQQHI